MDVPVKMKPSQCVLCLTAGSGPDVEARRGLGQSPRISLPAGEAGVSGAARAPERET